MCVGAAVLASSWLSSEQGPCLWTTLRDDALLSLLLRTEIEQQQIMRLYSYIILKLFTLNYFNNQIFHNPPIFE